MWKYRTSEFPQRNLPTTGVTVVAVTSVTPSATAMSRGDLVCFPGDILSRDVLLASAYFPRSHYCKQMYTRGVLYPFRQVSGGNSLPKERQTFPWVQPPREPCSVGLSVAATMPYETFARAALQRALWPPNCF